ncbi:MAG TPA: sugar ABC transporter permease [Ilumatobacteraceae bacterium]|nr:sugar ABC transporter permease [Ilumatobacteraceae bacterium]
MVDSTVTERETPTVGQHGPGTTPSGLERRLQLVVLWHLAGAVAAVVMMLLASRSGDEELPGTIGVFLRLFAIATFVAHAASAFGIHQRRRWGRTASLVVSYLTFVVAAVAFVHQLGGFTAIGKLGEGLSKAFVPFLVISVGLLWVLIAGQIAANRPAAPGPRLLRRAGWIVAAIGSAWFVVAADPSGLISTVLERIVQPVTIATVLLAAAAFAATRFVWRRDIGRLFGTTASTERTLTGLAFLSPNLLGFLFFFAGPVLFSLVVSFYDWKTTGTGRTFIGIDNYVEALSLDFSSASGPGAGVEVLKANYQVLMHLDWFGQHWVIGARDVTFWLSLRNITIFLVLAVPLSVLPALALSSILASQLRGMKIFRAIYFVPSVAGVIGVAIIWGQLFQSTVGWINYLIKRAGDILPFVEAPAEGQAWLSDNSTALLAMVVVFAWMSFGFNTVLYLAGHQAIPKELYEAAEIDGARTWKIFRRITVPQLRNTTFYVLITTSILALQLFDIVWILSTPQPGGPDNATMTPVIALYNEAFKDNNRGYASALAWVLFAIIFVFTFAQFRRDREGATGGMA